MDTSVNQSVIPTQLEGQANERALADNVISQKLVALDQETLRARVASYSVVVPCRNEEDNIGRCIESVLSQTVKPEVIVVVDDGSTGRTPEIIQRYAKESGVVHPVWLKAKRFKIRGWNISLATRVGLEELERLGIETDYVLKMDADTSLPPGYVESLIREMEAYPMLGVCGGHSDRAKMMVNHISDAARLYRIECYRELVPYPVMYGHDSHMLFKARYKGWRTKTLPITYCDARPYKRSIFRWFLTGRFWYLNGYSLLHAISIAVRHMRQTPYVLGSLTALLSFIVHHARRNKTRDEGYMNFMKRYLNDAFVEAVRDIMKGKSGEHIY